MSKPVQRRPAPVFALLVTLSAASLLPVACGERSADGGEQGGRSILVITMDTTRADHIHAYGYPLALTPVVDSLAARGVLFEEAYAPMPQTLPSHATLFTGLDPRQHGALENTYTLADDYQTLAETATERGYATGAFIGALVLDRVTGMAQGFATFDQPHGAWEGDREGHPPQRRAKEVTDAALAWADGLDAGRPYLLWAHYYDPHGDHASGYLPPERFLEQVPEQPVRELLRQRSEIFAGLELDEDGLLGYWRGYAAEIHYTDAQIGRLLDGLQQRGLLADTVIVLAGDHGEGLWQHGIKAHGAHVWQELHRVPLIVVHPDGERAGERVVGRATLRDVEPTLKHLAFGQTVRAQDGLGIDLWSASSAGSLPERPTFLERPHFDERRVRSRVGGVQLDQAYGFLTAVVMGGHKLVQEPGGTLRLYDLQVDPDELQDLATADPEQVARMSRLLESWLDDHPVGSPGEGIELSDERFEDLRALGYMDPDDG